MIHDSKFHVIDRQEYLSINPTHSIHEFFIIISYITAPWIIYKSGGLLARQIRKQPLITNTEFLPWQEVSAFQFLSQFNLHNVFLSYCSHMAQKYNKMLQHWSFRKCAY